MVDETPNTRLTPSGENLLEVNELANITVWVVLGALWSRSLAEHVRQLSDMALLLLSHELDEGHVFQPEASGGEVFLRKDY